MLKPYEEALSTRILILSTCTAPPRVARHRGGRPSARRRRGAARLHGAPRHLAPRARAAGPALRVECPEVAAHLRAADAPEDEDLGAESSGDVPPGRGLHSSTFPRNVSTLCGIRWVRDLPLVY